MKLGRYCFCLIALIVVGALPVWTQSSTPSNTSTHDGPFGFYRGMTQEQVVALLGTSAIEKRMPEIMSVTTAPKPHKDFEAYFLYFSPKEGLLKVAAYGKIISDDPLGSEIRSNFERVKTALTGIYGTSKSYDYLHEGAIWTDPADYMMSLHKQERVLASFWDTKGNPNHISGIELKATGINRTEGNLLLSYEFEGWDNYVDEKKAKQDSVF